MQSMPASKAFAFASTVLCVAALVTGATGASTGPDNPQKLAQSAQRSTSQSVPPPSMVGTAFPTAPRVLETRATTFRTAITDDKGKASMRRDMQAPSYTEQLGGGMLLELIAIPAGTYTMGSPDLEVDRAPSEGPQHQVSVKGFLLGKFEVTQGQWRAVAALPRVDVDLSPETSQVKGDMLPVGLVSWEEAREFCARLSKATGRRYRLPSEAEWEYACRGGSADPFAFGANVTPEVVNYDGNSPYGAAPLGEARGKSVDVGSLGLANRFGLFDMHGNVWEWCADSWHEDYSGAPTDGSVWVGGDESRKVLRGGSYRIFAAFCRSAARSGFRQDFRQEFAGFRVACDAP
jgi:formylglycine-generating enzyme required for sulfatase activity